MPDEPNIPLMDHELATDELDWMKSVYRDFAAARDAGDSTADPKDILRTVLGQPQYQMAAPADLSGKGPWRLGRNQHGRFMAAVFLPHVELHKHARSRTDQFPMYVVGEADAFSIDDNGKPMLTPVLGGDHFHNTPGAPHAFLPKVGKAAPENWEIAFIAITPRNLQEDTQAVSDDVRSAYRDVVGTEAPRRV
jgi:hypothetical protein